MLMTSAQVAQRLNVSLRTVHRLVSNDKLIPAQQLPGPNGAYLFDQAAVDAIRGTLRSRSSAPADGSSGQIARHRREELGLTRDQVAVKADVSLSTMVRFESEDHVPGGRALVRIARALGVTVEDLLPSEVANGAVA